MSQGVAEATVSSNLRSTKLVLWRQRFLGREGALDADQNLPLDGTQGLGDGGAGLGGVRVPGVASGGDAKGDGDDEAASWPCGAHRPADCSRAAKLARWRHRRRGYDGLEAQNASLRDSRVEAHKAFIEQRQARGGHGDGGAASSWGQEAHRLLRPTVWRHVLPDLKSLGYLVHIEPGNRILIVLRVYVRLPGEGAEGAGNGTGLSGVSSAPIASSQVVEVFANIH